MMIPIVGGPQSTPNAPATLNVPPFLNLWQSSSGNNWEKNYNAVTSSRYPWGQWARRRRSSRIIRCLRGRMRRQWGGRIPPLAASDSEWCFNLIIYRPFSAGRKHGLIGCYYCRWSAGNSVRLCPCRSYNNFIDSSHPSIAGEFL